MKKLLLAVIMLALPALALDVNVYTDKGIYQAGDTGNIFVDIGTAEENAEIIAEVVSPEGVIIDGAILYTDFPEKVVLNQNTWQTEQVLLEEGINYFTEGRMTRIIPFAVPQAAITGDYAVNVYVNGELKKSAAISIIGHEAVDAILLIYVLAIILIIGMKYYHHTDARSASSRRR